MLNKDYITSLIHFIDTCIEIETNEECLELLWSIDSSKFMHYYYNQEVIYLLTACASLTDSIKCKEMYKHILHGLNIEIAIGVGLN